jgi:choline dehydrogenase-like flavoprotein
MMIMDKKSVTFDTRKEVNFVIIGSGASGGVLAKELSIRGFDVVVLEQGPYRTARDFSHDEVDVMIEGEMTGHPQWSDPQTFRQTASENATVRTSGPPPALYARGVGGSSVHFTANYWRMRPVDFKEHSLLGDIGGTGFADWPISYEELEPYYTRVDWEIGVSGAPGPFDAPRSRPFPVPPLPNKSSGKGRQETGAACATRADGHPVTTAQRPAGLRPLRILHGFRLRSQRLVFNPGGHDSAGRSFRPLRNTATVDSVPD